MLSESFNIFDLRYNGVTDALKLAKFIIRTALFCKFPNLWMCLLFPKFELHNLVEKRKYQNRLIVMEFWERNGGF